MPSNAPSARASGAPPALAHPHPVCLSTLGVLTASHASVAGWHCWPTPHAGSHVVDLGWQTPSTHTPGWALKLGPNHACQFTDVAGALRAALGDEPAA